jgi:hypothetical protein
MLGWVYFLVPPNSGGAEVLAVLAPVANQSIHRYFLGGTAAICHIGRKRILGNILLRLPCSNDSREWPNCQGGRLGLR